MELITVISKTKKRKLYQWDLDRKVKIIPPEGVEVDEVHFAHPNDKDALVVKIYSENNELVADVPNILLQEALYIDAYLVGGDQTICRKILTVVQRPKPKDYVYTETEILRYESLEKRIAALEKNSGGGSSGEVWTTLYDITLEEDVNTIFVDTDMEGNPFKAKKMRLTFIGTTTDARLNLFFSGTNEPRMQNTYFYQAFIADKYMRVLIDIGEQLENGMCKSEVIRSGDSMSSTYTLSGAIYTALSTRYTEFLDRIRMSLQSEKYFTAGTRILIEGVLES